MRLFRTGIGIDVHRLVDNRPLVLGGVEIPHDRGLLGHSDADVVCHAIMDALLGALGAGDIGLWFPDRDPQYRGISSLILMERVALVLASRQASILNLDVSILAQTPRLSPHFPAMQERLAQSLGLNPGQVNIKATTTEGLGFIGTEEGIAALAVATLSMEP